MSYGNEGGGARRLLKAALFAAAVGGAAYVGFHASDLKKDIENYSQEKKEQTLDKILQTAGRPKDYAEAYLAVRTLNLERGNIEGVRQGDTTIYMIIKDDLGQRLCPAPRECETIPAEKRYTTKELEQKMATAKEEYEANLRQAKEEYETKLSETRRCPPPTPLIPIPEDTTYALDLSLGKNGAAGKQNKDTEQPRGTLPEPKGKKPAKKKQVLTCPDSKS